MPKDFSTLEDSNRSANPSIHDVSDPARRVWLRGTTGLALAGLMGGGGLAACASPSGPALAPPPSPGRQPRFPSVPMQRTDAVVVPPGYTARVLYRWGDPVGLAGAMPAWKPDASNTAEEQAQQAGMHHDGMRYFAIDGSSRHGLLALNHEYVDDGLLHPGGRTPWTAEKMRKSIAAHGVSVVEVRQSGREWAVVRPSRYARRITASTPMDVQGPAAGHPMMRTAADPAGRRVLGTFGNCANGYTPWGTYLTCEENWATYFEGPEQPTEHDRRWGVRAGGGKWYGWAAHDERFDARRHSNEPNRFGWVVEIDPFDPTSTPVKRTALGRAAHEGAAVARTRDGRVVVYMGEDARFEYIYKFVSRDPMRPGGAAANRETLDHGTLYVARFNADGSGDWLPLVHGQGPLTRERGFADQGEVVIKARQASDALGGTRMDRPEWTAVDPLSGEVYVTLTNNSQRGEPGKPPVDAANPRAQNTMGHIIRWRERGDMDAIRFDWTHFVLAGDPANARPEARGNIRGDIFGSPDGLWVDDRGLLWIQTDMSSNAMGQGDNARLTNNQMLAADPSTGEVRRFLIGPPGCEVTGFTMAPDGRSAFVNIQHPGEGSAEVSNPDAPGQLSSWPDGRGRPRSSTVVITKDDGGIVGS